VRLAIDGVGAEVEQYCRAHSGMLAALSIRVSYVVRINDSIERYDKYGL
jgi:galactokinase/mevalonate kinase-like predicted kinase